MSDNPPPLFNALPHFLIILGTTFTKTQFIRMCWLTWRTEILKEKLKK